MKQAKDSWRRKLDEAFIQYLGKVRSEKDALQNFPFDTSSSAAHAERPEEKAQTDRGFLERNRVDLDPEFMKALKASGRYTKFPDGGPVVLPKPVADAFDLAQALYRYCKTRPEAYLSFAFYSGVLGIQFDERHKARFGGTKLNPEKQKLLVAEILEGYASFLRGRPKLPKGKFDIHFAEMVNLILDHQKEPMTVPELRDALEYAGVHVPPDDSSFRVMLHRYKKKGLTPNYGLRRRRLAQHGDGHALKTKSGNGSIRVTERAKTSTPQH